LLSILSYILSSVAEEISWASEAFGARPDAINFWMGGSRSITSTHKDHYENLYAVVRGSKKFLLYPPVTLPFMPYDLYTTAQFKRTSPGVYDVVDVKNHVCCEICVTLCDAHELSNSREKAKELNSLCDCHKPSKVPWIAVDPLAPDLRHMNQFRHARSLEVTLKAGDLLYLPSLWFHHVRQGDGTVAVNYWYDMSYDLKYVYYRFLERLSQPKLANLL